MKVFKCPKCGEELEVPEREGKAEKLEILIYIFFIIAFILLVFNLFQPNPPI